MSVVDALSSGLVNWADKTTIHNLIRPVSSTVNDWSAAGPEFTGVAARWAKMRQNRIPASGKAELKVSLIDLLSITD